MQTVREIRCSSLDRYMNCSGFAQMTDLPPNEGGPAAEEGTAAGELLQAMLTQRTLKPTVSGVAANGVRFDADMYYYLSPISQELLNKNVPIHCEQRVDWSPCEGIVIRGQFDINYAFLEVGPTPGIHTLFLEDLKYGWKIVDVKKNWQLLGYAIGVIIRDTAKGMPLPKFISMTIHQPRPHHEDGNSRTWVITCDELFQYYNEIVERMKLIASGDRTLTTGKHCRYCPAAAERCPALNHACYNGINEVMYDFRQDGLTEAQLAKQYELFQEIQSLVKIKSDAMNDLICNRLREGKLVPGYGFEEQYGDRTWKGEVTPFAIEALTGINILEPVMLSPAKAEKLGVDKKLVAGLIERKFTGVKAKKKDFTKDAEKAFGKKG